MRKSKKLVKLLMLMISYLDIRMALRHLLEIMVFCYLEDKDKDLRLQEQF